MPEEPTTQKATQHTEYPDYIPNFPMGVDITEEVYEHYKRDLEGAGLWETVSEHFDAGLAEWQQKKQQQYKQEQQQSVAVQPAVAAAKFGSQQQQRAEAAEGEGK